jgi:hypothetical protein
MPLLKLFKNKEVCLKFKKTFSKPRLSNRELLAPPLTKNYIVIGNAFDYLLRFHLKQKYPKLTKDRELWVAHQGLETIKRWKGTPRLYKAALNIVKNAEIQYNQFLLTGILNDDLIQSCILFSKIDTIYRTGGAYYPDTLKDFLHIDKKDIQDLKNLISIVPFNEFKPDVGILLNPTFGSGSDMVDGSDADLIIDNSIIDIKATKNFYIPPLYWYQVLGYYLLYQVDINEPSSKKNYPGFPETKISQIGFYFARHGFLWKFPVDKIVKRGEKFDKFLSWFINVAVEECFLKR